MLLAVALIICFQLDDLSHKSSGSSLNTIQPPVVRSPENLAGGEFLRRTSVLQSPNSAAGRMQDRPIDEWDQKLYQKQGKGENVVLCLKIMVFEAQFISFDKITSITCTVFRKHATV
jgi:hypothetical protein